MQPNLASALSLRGFGLPAWAATVIALALASAVACPRHEPAARTPEPRVGRCSQRVQPRITVPRADDAVVPVHARY